MIKTLELLIERENERYPSLVNLETLHPVGRNPSTVSIHYCSLKKRKKKQRTMVYIFNVPAAELKSISNYKGNFQDKDFKWSEKLLAEYNTLDEIGEERERNAYDLVRRIIAQLKKDLRGVSLIKEKDNYAFFIKTLKRIGINRKPKQEELPLNYYV